MKKMFMVKFLVCAVVLIYAAASLAANGLIDPSQIDLSGYYTAAQTNATIEVAIAAIPTGGVANIWYAKNMVNGDYTGEVVIDSIETSMAAYTAVHYGSSGFVSAQADSYNNLPAVGLVLETGTGDKKVLLRGLVRNDSWDWVRGGRIYVSAATAGELTQTAPTTVAELVQIIGVAISSDEILLVPDTTCVEN